MLQPTKTGLTSVLPKLEAHPDFTEGKERAPEGPFPPSWPIAGDATGSLGLIDTLRPSLSIARWNGKAADHQLANGISDVRRKAPGLLPEREGRLEFRLEASLSSSSRHHEQSSPSRVEEVSMSEGCAQMAAYLCASGSLDPPPFPRVRLACVFWSVDPGQCPALRGLRPAQT